MLAVSWLVIAFPHLVFGFVVLSKKLQMQDLLLQGCPIKVFSRGGNKRLKLGDEVVVRLIGFADCIPLHEIGGGDEFLINSVLFRLSRASRSRRSCSIIFCEPVLLIEVVLVPLDLSIAPAAAQTILSQDKLCVCEVHCQSVRREIVPETEVPVTKLLRKGFDHYAGYRGDRRTQV